jgi:hypothetical protein
MQTGNGLSLQTGATFDGSDVIPEMDEEIWSPSEPTPIAQHFPGKVDMHNTTSPGWQNLNTSKLLFFNGNDLSTATYSISSRCRLISTP